MPFANKILKATARSSYVHLPLPRQINDIVDNYKLEISLDGAQTTSLTTFVTDLSTNIGLDDIYVLAIMDDGWNLGSGTRIKSLIGPDMTLVNSTTWGVDGVTLNGSSSYIETNAHVGKDFSWFFYGNVSSYSPSHHAFSNSFSGNNGAFSEVASGGVYRFELNDDANQADGLITFTGAGTDIWWGVALDSGNRFSIQIDSGGKDNTEGFDIVTNNNLITFGQPTNGKGSYYNGDVALIMIVGKYVNSSVNDNIRTSYLDNISPDDDGGGGDGFPF